MTLTEKWKKGELERANYWVKYKSGKIDTWELSGGVTIESKPEIIEVLAPVPSYEEWKELKDEVEIYHNNFKLMKAELERELENQQLKELLKECREASLDYGNHSGNYELYDRIDNVIGEK